MRRRGLISRSTVFAVSVILVTVFAAGVAGAGAQDGCTEVTGNNLDTAVDVDDVHLCLTEAVDGPIEIAGDHVTLEGGAEDAAISLDATQARGTSTVSVTGDDVTVKDLTIERGAADDRPNGASFAQAVRVSGSGATITGNAIVGDGFTGADSETGVSDNAGIFVLDGTGDDPATVENVEITNNTVSGFAYGIGAVAAYGDAEDGGIAGVTIEENTIEDSDDSALVFADGASFAAKTLALDQQTPEDTEPSIEDLQAQFNDLAASGTGLTNLASEPVDARYNWWGTPAGPAPGEDLVGAAVATPWCLDDGCTATSQADQTSLRTAEIQQPDDGATFDPGEEIDVVWETPIWDFSGDFFVVELREKGDPGSAEIVESSQPEVCQMTFPTQVTCEATLTAPESVESQTEYDIWVRPDAPRLAVDTACVQGDEVVDLCSTQEITVEPETPQREVIDLTLDDVDATFVPNEENVDVTYQAVWAGGPNTGEPVTEKDIQISYGDTTETKVTDLSGFATFTLSATDAERTVEASLVDPGDAEVWGAEDVTIRWTDITAERTEEADERGKDVGTVDQWADVGEEYRVAYDVALTHENEDLEDADVILEAPDGETSRASTDGSGQALVPVREDSPNRVTYNVTVTYNPDEGPRQSLTYEDGVTVSWAKVIYKQLSPNAAEDPLWYDAGDTVDFSFETYLLFGDDRAEDVEPAEGAEVLLSAPSETSSADESTTLTVSETGVASQGVTFEDNARTTPELSLESTVEGVTIQEDADFGDQRWATFVADGLTVETQQTDDYEDGWHAVGDEVTFGFQADLVFGEDRDQHSVPAEGAEVTFDLDTGDGDETLTVDGDGYVDVTRTVNGANETTPELSLVSTQQGVTATEIDAYDAQRWTEIDLQVSNFDDFVNVGDEVTFDLSAEWTHDGSPVQGADVQIVDASGNQVQDCEPFDGTTTCSVTLDQVYNDELTFQVTDTEVGITQQIDDTAASVDVTWTEIVVDELAVDDGFTDVGTTIEWTATATYAHTDADENTVSVPSASLALADGAPEACTLDEGTVTGGSLYANVTCSDVVDAEIPIAIATADDEVTQLAEPLNLVDTERDENPVWTGLDVQYETTDENGETIGDGELLDHEEPVRFEGTVQFAHLADGDGTAPPVNSVEFQVRNAADDVVSNCASDIDDNGAGTCVTEIRRTDGTHTFGIGAASFDEGDNGFPKRDVTEVLTDPGEVAFRWTSIAFEAFACEGSVNPDRTCEDDFESQDDGTGERVTVTVTAVAADTGEVLSDATITIDGNEETTNEAGQASRDFYTFQAPTCIDVTATGVEATIDGETIDWDTPRTEEICWG